VRPNFFCGQLLTDADLDASVEWARNRFALTRYRHGWGVVCGLDVTCTHPNGGHDCCPDPRKGPTVYVHPGYAIDCCGNDLVVCDPICVDLTDICRQTGDPCDPPPSKAKGASRQGQQQQQPQQQGQQQQQPQQEQQQQQQQQQQQGQEPQEPRQPYELEDCWGPLGEDLIAVDLKLRYHEDLAQGQRAMFRSGCSDSSPCEYTRVLERPCVYPELCTADCDEDDEYEIWDREFTIQRARAQRDMMAALKSPEAVLRYLRKHPPYKFCFLEELVCCVLRQFGEEEQPESRRDAAAYKRAWADLYPRIGFWLYLDWLLHQLECACWSCKPDRGVPLARVLLKRVVVGNETTCRVMLIDVSTPHRRPLHRETCRPVPRGAIDLAPYLWQSESYVRGKLGALGVTVEFEAQAEGDVRNRLDESPLFLRSDDVRRVKAWIIRDPFNCRRVVAFGVPDNL
jgi:hypothetical protein